MGDNWKVGSLLDTPMICTECKYVWIGHHLETVLPINFECPKCGEMRGYMREAYEHERSD